MRKTKPPIHKPKGIYAKRLRILRDEVLAVVPDDEFNMSTWGRLNCGTSACAMGQAAFHPRLRAEGLRLRLVQPDPELSGITQVNVQAVYKTDTDTFENEEAGEKFFGLTQPQAWWLFGDCYGKSLEEVTRKEVMRRITLLLAGRVYARHPGRERMPGFSNADRMIAR